MKKTFITCLLLLFSLPVWGQNFGLGVLVGDPTGISAKYWLDRERAIDGALGWSNNEIHIHGDHLWHRFSIVKIDYEPLDLFLGLGCRLDNDNNKDEDPTTFSIRLPIGLRYFFKSPPLELFGEIALTMSLIPNTSGSLDAGIGIRYFF